MTWLLAASAGQICTGNGAQLLADIMTTQYCNRSDCGDVYRTANLRKVRIEHEKHQKDVAEQSILFVGLCSLSYTCHTCVTECHKHATLSKAVLAVGGQVA